MQNYFYTLDLGFRDHMYTCFIFVIIQYGTNIEKTQQLAPYVVKQSLFIDYFMIFSTLLKYTPFYSIEDMSVTQIESK